MLTMGVEEEFHVLDAATGELASAAPMLRNQPGASFSPELQGAMVETASRVHTDLAFLRRDLVARRRAVSTAAQRHGLELAACGTVPGSGLGVGSVYPSARYEWMADQYRQIVAEQQLCACQVHVGVADRHLAVRVTRRIRSWLPVLLALSASSPLFQRLDTGYASYRTVAVSRWPTAGPPCDFETADEYDRTVAALVRSGVISDAGMIYFDARLSAHQPTVEIRVADSCPHIDDVVLLAALSRALVATEVAADERGEPVSTASLPLVRAASWRAARSGLAGPLISPVTWTARPAAATVAELLAYVRPVLTEWGEWDTVHELAEALLARGCSAERQRGGLRRGLSHAEVVAALVAETSESWAS